MARAPQPAPLQSPLQRRSQYLADALEQMRQEPQNIGGWGGLGARLLAQGITQAAAGKTEDALSAERANADLARRQRIAALVGGSVEGAPQEVGSGRLGNPLSGLADLVRGRREEAAPAPAIMPQPSVAPTPDIQGQPLPQAVNAQPPFGEAPAVPSPAPATPAAPQPAPNPLAASPEERALILRYLNSGDPGMVAQAEQMAQEIELRQAQPSWMRGEYQQQNGLGGRYDPATNQWTPIEGGIPEAARNQTFVAGENNDFGVPAGTLMQRTPTGVVSVVNKPAEGYERVGGRLRAEEGGPQDQGAGGNQISNERQLRGEFERETSGYRDARQGLAKVEAAAADASGASDVAMIFGYMKTLDPTSTVREGEAAMVSQTGSIPDRIVGLYNRAVAGERLTPQQRAEIAQAARAQFATYEEGYQARVRQYRSLAESYGLNSFNVIGEAGGPRRPAARPQPRTQQRRPQSRPAPRSNTPAPPPGFELD